MRMLICAAALATVFAAPAVAQTAVAGVTQVTTYGNNGAGVTQVNRDVGTNVTQVTAFGNNGAQIYQAARNSAAGVFQGTYVGNNGVILSQVNRFRR